MKAEHFEQALRDFRERSPFKPFAIELVTGRLIYVDHPEAVISRQGQAAHIAPDGAPSLFDNEGVARLFYESPNTAQRTSA